MDSFFYFQIIGNIFFTNAQHKGLIYWNNKNNYKKMCKTQILIHPLKLGTFRFAGYKIKPLFKHSLQLFK